MDDDQQFCLRWNNHQSTLVSVFDTLLEKGIHVDCTLAAEGQTLKAHKVVLSACSPYFESVLSQQYDKHPIIILKDVKYAELRAMMDYMYRGEVNISQDQLAALLKAAESLQIKGLSDNKPSRPPSRPAHPAPPAPAHPAPLPAHPPRPASPPMQLPGLGEARCRVYLVDLATGQQVRAGSLLARLADRAAEARDGSIDSREGSVSPTRRRKKARRLSSEQEPSNGDEPPCKEETRDGVEDLTIDEEPEDPPVTHNDVVRNFQWHMERSQDEMLNSSDGVRESQDLRTSPRHIMTRSKKLFEPEPEPEPERITTLAILKNVSSRPPEDTKEKENKKQPPPTKPSPEVKPAPVNTKIEPNTKIESVKTKIDPENAKIEPERKLTPKLEPIKFSLSPRERSNLPCAQYKTEKGYKCPNCQRCYNARKNLVRHVTLECGRDPQYRCPLCSYSKHRRNELKKHMERKHPDHVLPRDSPLHD